MSEWLNGHTEAMLARCTPRMREVAEHFMDGRTMAETARLLGISATRVSHHRNKMRRIFKRLSGRPIELEDIKH